MAVRKKKKRILSEEIAGVVMIALAILIAMGVYTAGSGMFGVTLRRISLGVLGLTAYILPGLLFVLGVYLLIYADPENTCRQNAVLDDAHHCDYRHSASHHNLPHQRCHDNILSEQFV